LLDSIRLVFSSAKMSIFGFIFLVLAVHLLLQRSIHGIDI
jgi:hypothetical protein